MKLGILLVGLGLVVCTYAYGIDQEDRGILNPAAEPSAPTRTRRPHTGALPSHITTPSTTKAKNSSVAVKTPLPVASVRESHDQQFDQSETAEHVVRPVYSQSAYEIDLQPFAVDDRKANQYESGSVGGPPPLALSGASYETSAPSQPSPSPLPASPSYSSPQPLPPPPPPSSNQHVVVNHGASYDVPRAPIAPQHSHQQAFVPTYHTSWSAPTQPLSSHAASSSSSSYGHQHQQTGHNDEQSFNKDEDSDDSGENDGIRNEHSDGAYSISLTAPSYAPNLPPLIPTYQLPQTTVRPIYQPPTQVVTGQYEPPNVPHYEPPRLSAFPQYQIPKVSTPPPQYEAPKVTTPEPHYGAPVLQPEYLRPIAPATLPQYEPARNPPLGHSPTPSYQVVAVEAEPANAAYPSPAAPSYIEEVYPDDLSAIPGTPGQDYPQMAKIPQSNFNCGDKLPGYYADLDSQCQVWHFCDMSGRRESFLCPNGTLYNQEKFVCDWWFNVDCGLATSFFVRNEELYKVPVRTPVAQYQPVEQQQQAQQGHYQQQQEGQYPQQPHGLQQQPHGLQQQSHGHQQQGHGSQQQQGHYQQEQQRGYHHQQQQEQHRGHYQQEEQHRHQQFESGSSSHDSSSNYGHGSQQSGGHVSSYSLTQEHPTNVSPAPQVAVSKQQQSQVTRLTTPSYVSEPSSVSTPVREVETSHSSQGTAPTVPIYGQTISTQKPHQEESESHIQSPY